MNSFHKVYEEPIIACKQPKCSQEEKRLGEERLRELNRLTSAFILRRTSEVNQQYLPSKSEYQSLTHGYQCVRRPVLMCGLVVEEFVLFCKPSSLQTDSYRRIVSSCHLQALINYTGNGSPHLLWINDLRKICNHPSLLNGREVNAGTESQV